MERFEWLCYAIMISPNPLLAIPSPTIFTNPSSGSYLSALKETIINLTNALPFPSRLLSPPYMFLLAELSAMLPRAIRAVGWYEERFGAAWRDSGRPGGRWVAIPGVL